MAAAILACTPVPTVAKTPPKTHTCKAAKWKVTKKPTCILEGAKVKKCTVCGKEMEKEAIPPTQKHNIVRCCCTGCGGLQSVDENDRTLMISSWVCKEIGLPTEGDLVVPEKVTYKGKTYTVVGVASSGFRMNKRLTSVSLPKTAKYIASYAFDGCENLKSCNLPKGMQAIEYAAFQCCFSLKKLNLPDGIKTIGNFAYNHCSSLENTTFRIPASLELMGTNARYPAHMFYDCGKADSFTKFVVDKKNKKYMAKDGILYTKDGRTLVSIPVGKVFRDSTYIMPNTVRNLGELSFSRNKSVHKVVISDNLIVSGNMETGEKLAYINHGNDLSVACYVYSGVEEYQTKSTNPRYRSVNGVLYTKNKKNLMAIPNQYKGVLDIPKGVITWNEEALWTEVDTFKNLAFCHITEIRIPATLRNIDKEQLESVNQMVDLYGTKVVVHPENKYFSADASGHLEKL